MIILNYSFTGHKSTFRFQKDFSRKGAKTQRKRKEEVLLCAFAPLRENFF
jgi:hypothetical protein